MSNTLHMRPITGNDEIPVLAMVGEFFQSSAVDHAVAEEVLLRSFQAVADPKQRSIWGYILEIQGEMAGYCYLSGMFSTELGGDCIFLEELYVLPSFQGRGMGKQVISWLQTAYPQAKRIRLEVTPSNQGAKKLYESMGFEFMSYEQMCWEMME